MPPTVKAARRDLDALTEDATTRISLRLKRRLRRECERDGRSESQVMRLALADYLDRKEKEL